MKKLILLMSLAMIVVLGCQKEEMNPVSVESDNQRMYVFSMDADNPGWQTISADLLLSNSSANAVNKSKPVHAHGNYDAGSYTLTFSGTDNNGGAHGSAEFRQVYPFGVVHVRFRTASVVMDGTTAIYSGQVSEIIEYTAVFPPPPPPPPGVPPPPPPAPPYSLGSYAYFKVLDNGQGKNAPPDQYNSVSFSVGSPLIDGGAGFFLWSLGTMTDLQNASDYIKVNN